jgi:hypothetical protein
MKIAGAAALVLTSCSCVTSFQNPLWLWKRSGKLATVVENRNADQSSTAAATTTTCAVYMIGSNYLESLSSNVQGKSA